MPNVVQSPVAIFSQWKIASINVIDFRLKSCAYCINEQPMISWNALAAMRAAWKLAFNAQCTQPTKYQFISLSCFNIPTIWLRQIQSWDFTFRFDLTTIFIKSYCNAPFFAASSSLSIIWTAVSIASQSTWCLFSCIFKIRILCVQFAWPYLQNHFK